MTCARLLLLHFTGGQISNVRSNLNTLKTMMLTATNSFILETVTSTITISRAQKYSKGLVALAMRGNSIMALHHQCKTSAEELSTKMKHRYLQVVTTTSPT